jgi:hypothetical protein
MVMKTTADQTKDITGEESEAEEEEDDDDDEEVCACLLTHLVGWLV